jgi:imidazole glycerol-phosphate synthase subunit HisH
VSTPLVGLVDYQAGNLWSIENAFAHLGADVKRITDPSDLSGCSHLVLPGVGAFGFCARSLADSGLLPAVHGWAIEERRPMLGLCVGMQLLADRSDESPDAAGLGWVGGEVRALPVGDGVRVPHAGWNTVVFETDTCGFRAGDEAEFYFDHSFALPEPQEGRRAAYCDHGMRFSAIVEHGNILATQFHPEKSQSAGLRLLAGFLER